MAWLCNLHGIKALPDWTNVLFHTTISDLVIPHHQRAIWNYLQKDLEVQYRVCEPVQVHWYSSPLIKIGPLVPLHVIVFYCASGYNMRYWLVCSMIYIRRLVFDITVIIHQEEVWVNCFEVGSNIIVREMKNKRGIVYHSINCSGEKNIWMMQSLAPFW